MVDPALNHLAHRIVYRAIAMGAAIGLLAFVISGVKEPGSLGSTRPPVRTCFLLLGTIMAVGRISDRQQRVSRKGV